MRCPECGLENPKEAQLCDCGHEFKEGDQGMTDKEYRKRNNRTLRIDICRIALEAIILAIIIQFIPKNIGAIPYLVIYFFAFSCIELFYRKYFRKKYSKDKFTVRATSFNHKIKNKYNE